MRGAWQGWGCAQLCLLTEHEPTGKLNMAVAGVGEELGCCQDTFQEWDHITTVLQVRSELPLLSVAGAVDMNIKQDTENSGSHNECVDRQGDVHRWNTTAQQVGMFNFIHIHPLQLLSCL